MEQIRPVIVKFQARWEGEDSRRKGGLDAIYGTHIGELSRAFSSVVTERGFEELRRRGEKI